MLRKTTFALAVWISVLLMAGVMGPSVAIAQQAPPGQVGLSPEQVINLALEKHEEGSSSEAMELLRAVLERDPGHVEANLVTGEILLDSNNLDQARNHFKQVLQVEPSNYRANLGVGKIWLGNRYWRQATSFLEKAERVAPPDERAEVKRLLAYGYASMGQGRLAVQKGEEAVKADPESLDALQTLVQIQMTVASRDPAQVDPAVRNGEKLVKQATEALVATPWEREALARLDAAYALMAEVLKIHHNSFMERTPRGEPMDQVQSGKGPDAAAALNRLAETTRQHALLRLIFAEHEALLLAEKAVEQQYDMNNVEHLEYLVSSYQQVQELTAHLAGREVYRDTTMIDRAVATCQRILQLDADNEAAQQYLQSVGVAPTPPPGAGAAEGP